MPRWHYLHITQDVIPALKERGVDRRAHQADDGRQPQEDLRAPGRVLSRTDLRRSRVVEDFRSLGKRLSNWGRWGAEDERGTVNFITPDKLIRRRHDDQVGQGVRPRHPLRRRGPAARRRAHQPRAPHEPDRRHAAASPAASSTPTTTSSCHCRARRSGTHSRTSSTTTRCTTASRRLRSRSSVRHGTASTSRARGSQAEACCSTSRS